MKNGELCCGYFYVFFQTKALISYSLFLSRDAGEDEALVSALNLEARGQRGNDNPLAPPLGPRQGKVVVGRGRLPWLRHQA